MSYAEFLKAIGYEPITTYWNSFSIADRYGEEDVKYTFKQLFKESKSDYKKLTELVMVLNHKMFQWSEIPHYKKLSLLYKTLWEKADSYATSHLKEEELSYFYRTTD